jgi:hypothetical protein
MKKVLTGALAAAAVLACSTTAHAITWLNTKTKSRRGRGRTQ